MTYYDYFGSLLKPGMEWNTEWNGTWNGNWNGMEHGMEHGMEWKLKQILEYGTEQEMGTGTE